MSKKYTHKQGFKPKDEIQIAIIKKNIPGLHGDILPKVQIIMDEWLKYSKLKQYLVDKYSNVPPFNGEFTTEVGVSKRSELSEKVFTILKKLSIAENPEGEDRYGLDTASTDIEKIFISETQQLQNRVNELEEQLSVMPTRKHQIVSEVVELREQVKQARNEAIQECLDDLPMESNPENPGNFNEGYNWCLQLVTRMLAIKRNQAEMKTKQ